MARPDRRVSLAVARIIPVVLLCAVVYATYAITKPLCIDYLIHPLPKYHRSPRVGTGAAIIVLYIVLLAPVIITYLRLLYNVVWNPGFLPRGSPSLSGQHDAEAPNPHRRDSKRRKRSRRHSRTVEKADTSAEVDIERGIDNNAGGKAFPLDTKAFESFYTKDVFVCQPDGRPIYCSTCCQYKTDRAHHCREVDRCVRKMDHFCPWVGGVVSETSFKFFIQFVFYTTIFCTYALMVCAIFTAELRRETGEVNPHWAVGIGLSCLFGIFTFGMTLSSVQLAMNNLTTIENLNRRSAVWTLAIRVPRHMLSKLNPDSRWAPTFRTITYPLPLIAPNTEATTEYQQCQPTGEQHVFAILQTLPGENPFDLGTSFKNLQQVLGYSLLDWLLPLKQSPCADHGSLESAFALGPVVRRLKAEAGLENLVAANGEPTGMVSQRKQRRSKPKRHS
ncbi:zf-DHHC-domain-containing protein [Aspergillus coremiiformis]|uniref:Palmitoyltransferase n=1 Tax=Aspergillus coremiiformis TaxID=138285 RepID=A0A5N6Z566_9EURO|nr:zf-DHHC-domain-containing protein [Aspergillus coremiiformis]